MDDHNTFEEAVRTLLHHCHEDPHREGLLDTPARVRRAYGDWFSGYGVDPRHLFRTFAVGSDFVDEMILVANCPVFSHCEHHMTPFFGLAHIAYIPAERVLGLSKFARLVEIFARRLQIQERLTGQIADVLMANLMPVGVGVVLECRHLCLESRGVRARGAVTTTSALRGALLEKPAARAEFFSLVRSASKSSSGI